MTAPNITSAAAKLNNPSPFRNLTELNRPEPAIPKSARVFSDIRVHEIRNPLANIFLAAQAGKMAVRNKHMELYLDIIIRNAMRIKTMVDELLIRKVPGEGKPEAHSARRLLDDVLKLNEDRLILKGVAVRKNYGSREFEMSLSQPQAEIVLTNIIINAIEAMPQQGALLEIVTKQLNGVCFVVIKDNGTGISKDNLNRIFNSYFTDKPGGMGLGLAGSLKILNTGHIGVEVRSTPGQGTRFILWFRAEQR